MIGMAFRQIPVNGKFRVPGLKGIYRKTSNTHATKVYLNSPNQMRWKMDKDCKVFPN